jgi:hypothetical protein
VSPILDSRQFYFLATVPGKHGAEPQGVRCRYRTPSRCRLVITSLIGNERVIAVGRSWELGSEGNVFSPHASPAVAKVVALPRR